jgi:hypothetical protein
LIWVALGVLAETSSSAGELIDDIIEIERTGVLICLWSMVVGGKKSLISMSLVSSEAACPV